MSNIIKLKRGSGSDPSASDLVVGEVALRTDSGKLFTKKDNGNVAEIGGSGISDGDKGDITVSNSGDTFTIDNGVVTSAKIADGTIDTEDLGDLILTNAKVATNAAIAGTKISPDFGSQNIETTGDIKIDNLSKSLQVGDITNDNYVQISQENVSSGTAIRGFTTNYNNASVIENLQGNLNQHLVLGDSGRLDGGTIFGISITQSGTTYTRLTLSGTGDLAVERNITLGGTVDGRNVASDGSKLDGIESGATADQTVTEIKSLIAGSPLGSTHIANDSITANELANNSVGNSHIIDATITNTEINGSAAIAGTKISPDFGSQNITTTGFLNTGLATISGTNPRITFNDTNNESDFAVENNNGNFRIVDIDNSDRYGFQFGSDGNTQLGGNTTFGGDLIVPDIIRHTGDSNTQIRFPDPDAVAIQAGGTERFRVSDHVDVIGNLDVSAGLDVTGNITVTGTVDGVDIAARNTLFGGLTSSSGVLTNGVTATTQAQSDNSTKVSTTAYVRTAVSNLVNSAPSTLDTLKELSDALGADANFSTTVTNSIATKLPLAGGTLTGNLLIQRSSGTSSLSVTSTDDYATLEIGGSTGAFIDLKSPASDDYDIRFVHSGHIYAKTNITLSPTSGNVVNVDRNLNALEGLDVTGAITGTTSLTLGNTSLSSGYLINTTGDLYIRDTNGNIFIQAKTDQNSVRCIADGAVILHHSGTARFETTSTGIQVDGTDTNLTIRSGTASGSAGGLINFKNVDANGQARDVARIKGFSDGTGGYGEITFQTAFNNSLNDVLRITKEQTLEIIGSNQYPVTIDGSDNGKIVLQGSSSPYIRFREGTTDKAFIQWHPDGYLRLQNQEDAATLHIKDNFVFSPDNSSFYTIWHSGNDGSGSGLDADTLDGVSQASFLRSDATDTATGAITFTNSHLQLSGHYYQGYHSAARNYIHFYPQDPSNNAGSSAVATDIRAWNGSSFDTLRITGGSNTILWRNATIWHSNNDGSGSGLDSDLLDGQHGSYYRNASNLNAGTIPAARVPTLNQNTTGNAATATEATNVTAVANNTTNTAYRVPFLSAATGTSQLQSDSADGMSYNPSTGTLVATAFNGNGASLTNVNATTLDSINSGSFLRSDANDTSSGVLTLSRGSSNGINLKIHNTTNASSATIEFSDQSNQNQRGYLQYEHSDANSNSAGNSFHFDSTESSTAVIIDQTAGNSGFYVGTNEVFHAGNDGSGSGLDADTLDGQQGSYYWNKGSTGLESTNRISTLSNFNNSVPSGFYQSSTASNMPGTSWHNMLNVRHSNTANDHGFQLSMSYYNEHLYSRTYKNGSGNNDGTFTTWAKQWSDRNDGSGSGLDADTVDGVQVSNLVRSDQNDVLAGEYTFTGGANAVVITSSDIRSNGSSDWTGNPGASTLKIQAHSNRWYIVSNSNSDRIVQFRQDGTDKTWIANDGQIYHGNSGTGDKYWRQGNDGSGSGLDADTVDGIQASSFLRSDADDNTTGKLLIGGTYSNNAYNSVSSTRLLFGGGNDPDNYHIGTNMENFGGNYSKLDLRWHTGIRMGAQPSYGGIRFYNNEDLGSIIFSVNKGDGNTRIESGELYHNTSGTSDKYWREGNDGSGSGLDADTVDGIQASSFIRSDVNDFQVTQRIEFRANETYNYDTIATASGSQGSIEVFNTGAGNDAFMAFHAGQDYACYFGLDADINDIAVGGWSMGAAKYRVWHQNNDGSGSGLDSDTVDGIHGSSFLRSDASDSATQPLTFSGGGGAVTIGGNSDMRFVNGNWAGNTTGGKIQAHGDKLYIAGLSDGIVFRENATDRWKIDGSGHYVPASNNTYNIGSTSLRVANLYVNDMHFSNEGKTNDVDGSWGDWTLQEGEEDIFMINNRTGKKFKIAMIPV